ncbi:MAG: alpha/beta fold hydrolase [Promethearchaeota archaeon]|jgi:pimeloyl-ACP methyl ester carboxylesterase
MKSALALVNDIKICYEIHGDGDTVLLVHGLGTKKEAWIGQTEPLAKHFKVIRFDNRGAGKSDRPDTPYTMEIFADDINGLMDFLEIKKCHIIGWSLGGMIVQNFILKYPQRVKKVVLINTNYGTPDESGAEAYKRMRLQGLKAKEEDPIKAFWQSIRTDYHIKFRKQMEADPSKKWYGLWSVDDLIQMSTIDPPTEKDIIVQAGALATHHTFERLHEIKNETLLITSSHDRITPQSVMVEMHGKIPNSTLKIIDKSGHGSPRSRAPEINQLITEFLKN